MQSTKTRWRTFYVPAKKHVGAALKDAYGRIYMVQLSGALKMIQDAKACTPR